MTPRLSIRLLATSLLVCFLSVTALGQNNNGGGGFGGGGGGGFGGGGGGGFGRGGGGGFGGQNGPPTAGQIQQFMQQRQQAQMDNLKTQLGATDDEFAVLQPYIQTIMDMQTASTVTRFIGQMNRINQAVNGQNGANGQNGGNGQNGQGGNNGPPPGGGYAQMMLQAISGGKGPTELQTAALALQAVIDNPDAAPEEFAGRLAAFRAARASAAAKLAAAQDQLRQLLTQRQEAVLVLQGYLE